MVKCREITQADLPGIADLLASAVGIEAKHWIPQPRAFWVRALDQLTRHPTPPGFPRYGYTLDTGTALVGVILLICTDVGGEVRINTSSWYVQKAYRHLASRLGKEATARTDAVYFNTTAAPNTWPLIRHHGFAPYCAGTASVIPALRRSRTRSTVELATADRLADFAEWQRALLLAHAARGCLSLIVSAGRLRYPFVFRPDRRRGVPVAHLVYSPAPGMFAYHAGPLGRYLLRHGIVAVLLDADKALPGIGSRFEAKPKFRKGREITHVGIGDVAWSEEVLFQ